MKVREEGYRRAEPGTVDEAFCHVCGAACAILRGVVGPTCFAEAMGKRARHHDAIECPHGGEDWHNHAVRLRTAIAETPSPRLAALVREDLADVLAAGLSRPRP